MSQNLHVSLTACRDNTVLMRPGAYGLPFDRHHGRAQVTVMSGAMFDRKGLAILPTPKLKDSTYLNAFITASEALVSRANVCMASHGSDLP